MKLTILLCFIFYGLSSASAENAEQFNITLAKQALQFAATAYAVDPTACLIKNSASMVYRIQLPCDYLKDECWGLVLLYENWIIVTFRGTRTKLQLITELVETMSEPKRQLRAGGSVQHYFYVALKAIWAPILKTIRKLKIEYPDHRILFTGHSLGGALASLASTVFAHRHPHFLDKIYLITFGQPRVGNFEYSQAHDRLIAKSWRVVHKYDLVAHLPACAISLLSRTCTPFFNHAPYHHGTEIWFPMNMTDGSLYSACKGLPMNEDQQCSNGWYLHYGIRDHVIYFEHNVSEYGRNECVDPQEDNDF